MAEIPFEYLLIALEATRNTAITTPTYYLPVVGSLKPETQRYAPQEARGELERSHRSKITRQSASWSGNGPLDTKNILPLLSMIVKSVTSPSTPGGATLSRLWEYVPTLTSDDVKSATVWWGDPNVQIFRSAFGMLDNMVITANPANGDGTTIALTGFANFPAQVTAPTTPTQLNGPLVVGGEIELWLDTSSAIGTTAITGRVLNVTHTIPLGAVRKYHAVGPGGSLGFGRIGRNYRQITTQVTFELLDMAQYDLFAADTFAKLRVRHNSDLIESGFYHYVEVDTYGPLDFNDWGDLEGVNRTITLTINSEKDTTLGASWRMAVQNAETALQ